MAIRRRPWAMGIKYHYEVKDHKLAQRFQNQQAKDGSPAANPGQRAAKKLTKKQAARLAAKQAESE